MVSGPPKWEILAEQTGHHEKVAMQRIQTLIVLFTVVTFAGCSRAPSSEEIAALTLKATGPVQGEQLVASAKDWPGGVAPTMMGIVETPQL